MFQRFSATESINQSITSLDQIQPTVSEPTLNTVSNRKGER